MTKVAIRLLNTKQVQVSVDFTNIFQ